MGADPRGSECLLIAEDEPGVRSFAALVLRNLGYTVLVAEHAASALAVAQAMERPIDLLLTDVVRPGMQGAELFDQLCTSRPSLKVLYMSGFTTGIMTRQGVLEPDTAFLAKPFTARELGRKIRETLDRS